MRHRFVPAAALILTAALSFAGCSSGSGGAPKTAEATKEQPKAGEPVQPVKVTIGWTPSFLFLPAYLAQEMGFFKAEGIAAEFIAFGGGSEVSSAMLGNSIEFGATTAERPLVLLDKGQKSKNLVSLQNAAAFTLIVRSDVPFTPGDIKSLKGKKIGMTKPGGGLDKALRGLIKEAGLDPEKDFSILGVGGVDQGVVALQSKSIDAFMSAEPATSTALSQLKLAKSSMDFRKGEGPAGVRQMTFSTLQATDDYIAKNPQVVERVVRAIVKAENAIAANPDAAIAATKKLFPKMDDATLKEAFNQEAALFRPEITPEMVKNMYTALKAAGDVKMAEPKFADVTAVTYQSLWGAK